MNEKKRSSRRLGTSLAFCAALGGTMVAAERPAQAAVDPVSVVAYVKAAYEVIKFFESLFGGGGDDIAPKLDAIKADIINELHTLRNEELKANADSVFTLFLDLTDNAKSDPTNPSMWVSIRTLQQTTADAMHQVLQGSDTTSQYALLPAYNSLMATGTALLAAKKEISSRSPSSWRDFYIWAQPGIDADYRMVGAKRHQCYPGFNPGYLPPPPISQVSAYLAWSKLMKSNSYKKSVLWKSKLANKMFHVETWTGMCCGSRAGCGQVSSKFSCNPATGACQQSAICSGGFTPQTRTFAACSGDVGQVACAEQLATTVFDNDAVVKVARSGMKGLMTLSGGSDYNAATNDPLLAEGQFVDPWVNESSCGSGGPWAYPQLP